jgi:hypothetical protein
VLGRAAEVYNSGRISSAYGAQSRSFGTSLMLWSPPGPLSRDFRTRQHAATLGILLRATSIRCHTGALRHCSGAMRCLFAGELMLHHMCSTVQHAFTRTPLAFAKMTYHTSRPAHAARRARRTNHSCDPTAVASYRRSTTKREVRRPRWTRSVKRA